MDNTLPSGSMETGTFATTVSSSGSGYGDISFPIPLKEFLLPEKIKIMSEEEVFIESKLPAGCTLNQGNLVIEPDPGFMCVMVNNFEGVSAANVSIHSAIEEGIIAQGAVVKVTGSSGDLALGTWAVKAP